MDLVSQEELAEDGSPLTREQRWMKQLARVVHSERFDLFFGFMIVANACVLALSVEYQGSLIAEDLQIADNSWDTDGRISALSPRAIDMSEHFFAILFLIELMLRLAAEGKSYLHHGGNWFDIFLVVSSV